MSSAEPRRQRTLTRLGAARVVPVLRMDSAPAAVDAAARCLDAGLPAVELTATTPDWPVALRGVRAAHPDRLIGVGTVLTTDDARRAIEHGADFLVSPCPAPSVRDVVGPDILLVEGGLTVGEVLDAAGRGIAKLFPAHVGGVQYLRSILAVAPSARIIPTGGIRLEDAAEWLAAGAYAVGVGSDLVRQPDIAAALRGIRTT